MTDNSVDNEGVVGRGGTWGRGVGGLVLKGASVKVDG